MIKILISMIGKMLPKSIAQDIVGVQPMTKKTNHIFTMKGDKVGFKNYALVPNQNECILYDTPDCKYYAVDVRPFVGQWLEEQPNHMWKYAEETEDCQITCTRYIISEKLLICLSLRWSS
jgi:hypothetical protein